MPHRKSSPNPEVISIASLTNDNARINALINQLELGLPQLQKSHARLTGPFTNAVLERLRVEFARIEKALTKVRNRTTVSSPTWLLGYVMQESLAAPSGQYRVLDVEGMNQLETEVTEKKKVLKEETEGLERRYVALRYAIESYARDNGIEGLRTSVVSDRFELT
ncbi:hypothetical protein LTR16_000322 [Cryomyces antarcticus]|uniref:Uncharacterized protein n=1 Tax=Cryomyces antarcticus TaxID=329879 RepID=A0ABR0M097_9PEZI|nr:hypothetical protein LTR60_000065 [Cryomyces antarcticus]KAK5257543.1 hypothetical protein LTR16_000322 [Cryomyces antarcticus]